MYLDPEKPRSTAQYVEAGWRKSSKSNTCMACVEVMAGGDGWVHVRDSKFRRGGVVGSQPQPVISVREAEFAQLLDWVANRQTDLPGVVAIDTQLDGNVIIRDKRTNVSLRFHDYEWDAFAGGVLEGEFAVQRLLIAV